jgi:hypothetical protein
MVDLMRIFTFLVGLLIILTITAVIFTIYANLNNIYVPLAVLTIIAYMGLSKMTFLDKIGKNFGNSDKEVICGMCGLEMICDLRNKGKTDVCSIFTPKFAEEMRKTPP